MNDLGNKSIKFGEPLVKYFWQLVRKKEKKQKTPNLFLKFQKKKKRKEGKEEKKKKGGEREGRGSGVSFLSSSV